MRNSKALMEKIDKLDRLAEDIAGEISILERCRRRGLDYDDPVDYSAAALKAAVDHAEEKEERAEKNSKTAGCKLQYSNPVETDTGREYNRNRISANEGNSLEAEYYGFLGKLWEIGHAVKQKLIGRVVKNNTGERIAIVGQPRISPTKTAPAYLRPGESSSEKFEDVDAVMIAMGQKFYTSKLEIYKKNGEIRTSGAIKVRDGGTAEVARSPKRPDVFYVNAAWTTYFEEGHYPESTWKLP